ncbi:ATP-binding protein [Fulvimarina sp. 2208YS6-2-32]|uniref:ATP-binding protein n=1 Tax=Fulvimarina uroteuthidis TaxID=3098149 RepID=A0ABU5I862_9HYPH|nr:ATP-binding protein [Fulvimarina sp. 2208YS6-2-32]MDY8111123.1 ATP-binding protein [Fulvimarina sp. 2208YS6-2-32]
MSLKNPQITLGSEASLIAPSNLSDFQFERADWTLFRSINTLPQKAGVPVSQLRRLVLKELADNALDAGGNVRVRKLDDTGDRWAIEDDGPGIDPAIVPHLFSINRPLASSKLRRMPTRGAMGNGLRVVAGSVIASSGALEVRTRNTRLVLKPQDDGSTIAKAEPCDHATGTTIEITFGADMPKDEIRHPEIWANRAARLNVGESYGGRSSPYWYDRDSFYELLQAAGDRTVRDLIAEFDGCSGAKAGKVAAAFKGRSCASMTRDDAANLHDAARAASAPVNPKRLGLVGDVYGFPTAHAVERGEFQTGAREPTALLPFVVEAWVGAKNESGMTTAFTVNRTPIAGNVRAYREKGKIELYGCGLSHEIESPGKGLAIYLNVTTPYCPITTDGKEPDLEPFAFAIMKAVKDAARRAKKALPKVAASDRITAKSVVLDNVQEAVEKASGGGLYRFNQRQLFYVLRPAVIAATGAELSYKNFEGIITDYETENGDVPGMYRDPRGTLYHPHEGRTIPLGTLAVEDYERPSWTFNKVLYIEKEGPFEALKSAKWPERHDCALLTSKGYTTRAVKDLLDLLDADGEPITVFCIHDADAAGTMIYQTLQEETRARPTRRTVEIVNLGLDPWEAIDMGLEIERIDARDRKGAVARYVVDRPDGSEWQRWLMAQRIELNAMTTPQFIEWLDGKMAAHEGEKVVPPVEVIKSEMRDRTADHVRRDITERVLREARIDQQVRSALEGIEEPDAAALSDATRQWLSNHRSEPWRTFVDAEARKAASR